MNVATQAASQDRVDLGVILQEPAEIYHAKAREYLSSHQLGDFRRCPALYHKKKLGLVPDEDRPAYVRRPSTPNTRS